jgi:hypothetical protein
LCLLETEKSELQAKLERQQQALHTAVVSRDTQIQALREALTAKIVAEPTTPDDSRPLAGIIADLERRLAVETRRRTALEERLTAAQTERDTERAARLAAERANEAMRVELESIESSLIRTDECPATPDTRLEGVVLLYVGGRPNQVAHMRAVAERFGATFLHHDGGVENHPNLLPGLTSRSSIVLFPVDCISHDAANAVKSLCRQGGKRFIPLRSASVTSLLSALQTPEVTGMADAAD